MSRKLQVDVDQVKVKSQDLERAERLVRVDLEQTSKRVRHWQDSEFPLVISSRFVIRSIKAV